MLEGMHMAAAAAPAMKFLLAVHSAPLLWHHSMAGMHSRKRGRTLVKTQSKLLESSTTPEYLKRLRLVLVNTMAS